MFSLHEAATLALARAAVRQGRKPLVTTPSSERFVHHWFADADPGALVEIIDRRRVRLHPRRPSSC